MAKKFEDRKKVRSGQNPIVAPDRNTERPWEKLFSGWRGREKYSREWNSGYDGPNKGTW